MGKNKLKKQNAMENGRIGESELIINPDGSVYHLHLKPGQLADTVITVGDPARVAEVSQHFDTIQHVVQYREFLTHTGVMNNNPITVLSTGMGTDNIDIVMNELDALVNVDFEKRIAKEAKTRLDIIRVGTSGTVSEDIGLDTVLISEVAIGMDGLLNYYEYEDSIWETVYLEAFTNHLKPHFVGVTPYIASASESLLQKFEPHFAKGTTITACGFYAPQGRKVRAQRSFPNFVEVINKFRHKHFRITNLEMETSGIYGMGKVLGHNCLSVNAILADRINQTFSEDPKKLVADMIEKVLEIATT
jgi:uridine phosphorylase